MSEVALLEPAGSGCQVCEWAHPDTLVGAIDEWKSIVKSDESFMSHVLGIKQRGMEGLESILMAISSTASTATTRARAQSSITPEKLI